MLVYTYLLANTSIPVLQKVLVFMPPERHSIIKSLRLTLRNSPDIIEAVAKAMQAKPHGLGEDAPLACRLLTGIARGRPVDALAVDHCVAERRVNRILVQADAYFNAHGAAAKNAAELIQGFLRTCTTRTGRPPIPAGIEESIRALGSLPAEVAMSQRAIAAKTKVHPSTVGRVLRRPPRRM